MKKWILGLLLVVVPPTAMYTGSTIKNYSLSGTPNPPYNVFGSKTTAGSTLDDSTLVAYWKLDELSGTRAKTAGSCASCDLTAVNAPLASGGAGGYALNTTATNQSLQVADTAELSSIAGVAAWVKPTTGWVAVVAKDGVASQREFVFNDGSSNCYFFQSDGVFTNATIPTVAGGERALVFCWWDSSDQKVHTQKNTAAPANSAGTITGVQDSTSAFKVNLWNGVGSTGVTGPLMVWKGGFPNSTDRTTLYNSGLGYSCVNIPTALRTNLSACWDLSEASGTRVASTASGAACTTNCDMSAVNAPGRTAGLVQNGMGMSASFVAASNQYLITSGAAAGSGPNAAITANVWVSATNSSANASAIFGRYLTNDATSAWLIYQASINPPTVSFLTVTGGSQTVVGPFALGLNWHMLTLTKAAGNSTPCLQIDNGSLNCGASVTISAPTAEFRIGRTNVGAALDGAVDAAGQWDRVLTAGEITALYASGVGVEYPWSSIVDMFQPSGFWADRSLESKQRVVWAKTGVFVPEFMFPSAKVIVLR